MQYALHVVLTEKWRVLQLLHNVRWKRKCT